MDGISKIKRHFHSLSDVMLFIQILVLATLLPIALKHMTLMGMMSILTPGNIKGSKRNSSVKRQRIITTYTDYILNRNIWIYSSTCLKRSLLLYHFLRKSGFDVHVCFGIRYEKDLTESEAAKSIEGHAWLMYNGDYYLERDRGETGTYTMTYCYPGTS